MTRRLFGGFGSVTSQLIVLIFLVQLALTGVLLAYVQWSVGAQLRRDQQAYVRELRDTLIEIYNEDGVARLGETIEARVGTGGWAKGAVLLTRASGTPIAGNLRAWPVVVPTQTGWRELDLYRAGAIRPERIGLTATRLPGGEKLLTGWVLDEDVREASFLEETTLASLLLVVPLALLTSLAFGRMLSRRLGAISGTTVAVAGGDLSRRVPRDGSGDAFDILAMRVNAMLERVESLISELRLITDGLAHDLRSPLTRVRLKLEQASAAVDEPVARAAITDAQAELGTLLKMLATTLQITRAEAGIGTDQRAPVALADLLDGIAELYGPVAEEAGFTLAVAAPPALSARLHRELVGQAIANLIENALVYATGGHRILLAATKAPEGVAIAVSDDGPGIPPDLRDQARRRFVRLDPARRETGSGLGLALVDAVARLHGGRLDLDDAGPGLRATLVLPTGSR